MAECHTDRKQNGHCQGLGGEGRNGELVLNGNRASFRENEDVLEMNMVIVTQQCEYT